MVKEQKNRSKDRPISEKSNDLAGTTPRRPVDSQPDNQQEQNLLEFLVVGDEEDDEWDDENAERAMEYLAVDAGAADEDVMDDIDDYTDDPEILEDFEARQNIRPGSQRMRTRLGEHHSLDPDVSADDVDAAWDDANVAGEEAVGGSTPTPDQDIVDELGEAVGITYADDEELDTDEKLRERDRSRFELDPDSVDTEYNPAVEPEEPEGEDEDLDLGTG